MQTQLAKPNWQNTENRQQGPSSQAEKLVSFIGQGCIPYSGVAQAISMSTAGAKAPVCCIGPQDGVHIAQNPQVIGMLILRATSSCLILGRDALHR